MQPSSGVEFKNYAQQLCADMRNNFFTMQVRCSQDRGHTKLNLHQKRCGECSWSLQKLCATCEAFVNYANFALHKKSCFASRRKLRFAFLASAWNLDKKPPSCPLGQFRESLPVEFPAAVRRMVFKDPTGDSNAVDAYDAVWGSLALDPEFELVHVFHSLQDLLNKAVIRELHLDVLVVGDWIHPAASKGDRADVETLLKKLEDLELDLQLRVFPPLDYSWWFAQKAHLMTRIQKLPFLPFVKVIPTTVVSMEHVWKPEVQEFGKKHGAKKLMVKRELSDTSSHVMEMAVGSLSALPGRTDFRWIVQPWLSEFSEYQEMRMYVIEGKCTFGCMSKFTDNSLSVVATAPGRRSWSKEGGREAAAVAEHVVAMVSRDQAHASQFLRVDLVKRHDGGWWLSELEFFGNAHLLFEVFDNATELLDVVVGGTKRWIQSIVS